MPGVVVVPGVVVCGEVPCGVESLGEAVCASSAATVTVSCCRCAVGPGFAGDALWHVSDILVALVTLNSWVALAFAELVFIPEFGLAELLELLEDCPAVEDSADAVLEFPAPPPPCSPVT